MNEEFAKGIKKTLLILPTGTGKTSVGAEIIDQFFTKGLRVLWLAHREELLQKHKMAGVSRIY